MSAIPTNTASTKHALLRVQIASPQDFIAAARSTRDLWSGSYLLSWLTASGIKAAQDQGANIVYPVADESEMFKFFKKETPADTERRTEQRKIPSFSNIFLATVPQDFGAEQAKAVAKAIHDEWEKIGKAVLKFLKDDNRLPFSAAQTERFVSQIRSANFPAVAWQITPGLAEGNWRETYEKCARDLDATRLLRDFAAADFTGWNAHVDGGAQEKDSLSGALEHVADGAEWLKNAPNRDGVKERLKDGLLFSAPTLVKRFWDLAYLRNHGGEGKGFSLNRIANTHGIARHKPFDDTADDDDTAAATADSSNKYFAVLMFDGDSVGQWISGQKTDAKEQQFHSDFSQKLSEFAAGVGEIVRKDGNDGFLIYAGGDDVLALLPADSALRCAREIRKKYRETLDKFKAKPDGSKPDGSMPATPDGSCGIAIAHFKTPLQDVVKMAQEAEKRKSRAGRGAVCVTLAKRSGEILKWDNKWEWNPDALHVALVAAMNAAAASAKLPHRIIALLAPYLSKNAAGGLAKMKPAADFDAAAVAKIEIEHALSRQCPGKENEARRRDLEALFHAYATAVQNYAADDASGVKPDDRADFILGKLIGLCTAAAFASRTTPANTKENQ